MQQGDDPAKAIQVLSSIQPMDSDTRAAVQLIQDGYQVPKGRMYEVNIDADPEDFLDWDAPLSQQSKKVDAVLSHLGLTRQQAMAEVPKLDALATRALADGVDSPAGKAFDAHNQSIPYRIGRALADSEKPPNTWGYTPADKTTGMEIVRSLGSSHSEALQKAGIPGIKYLDGTSRAAGQGSRNYVVFDDKLISIVKKYGIAAALSAGAISELEARQMQAQGYQ